MKSLRRFFATARQLADAAGAGTSDCGKRSKSTSRCKPPKIFAPVYHQSKRGGKPC